MAKLIELTCPDCGRNISASSLERETRCEHCGKLIFLTNHPDSLTDVAKVLAPPYVEVAQAQDRLSIKFHWFKPHYIAYFVFSFLIAIPFNILALLNLLSMKGDGFSLENIEATIPGICMLGLLGWSTIHLFNWTVIEISGDELSVRFAPFPWFGYKRVQISELKRLVCSEHIIEERRSMGPALSHIECEIYAYQKSSLEKFLLISDLPSREAAYFVKHMIEAVAGIE